MTAGEYTLNDVKREAGEEQVTQQHLEKMQLIIFKLGGEEYGLSIDQIKEVVITPRIAKMPQTPDYIKGVANIRGSIIAIIDLENKFNLAITDNRAAHYTLVVESEEYKVGILVKEVPNTLSVNVSDIDNASGFIHSSSLDMASVIGVVKSGARMIILIDMIKLIKSENLNNIIS